MSKVKRHVNQGLLWNELKEGVYVSEKNYEALEKENAELKAKIMELEDELGIAIECIENSGIDYDEATEHLREKE